MKTSTLTALLVLIVGVTILVYTLASGHLNAEHVYSIDEGTAYQFPDPEETNLAVFTSCAQIEVRDANANVYFSMPAESSNCGGEEHVLFIEDAAIQRVISHGESVRVRLSTSVPTSEKFDFYFVLLVVGLGVALLGMICALWSLD